MTKQEIRTNHDKIGDVFYITFGNARPSYAETISDGIYARYDMETDELRGITILDYSKRNLVKTKELIFSEIIMTNPDDMPLDFLH